MRVRTGKKNDKYNKGENVEKYSGSHMSNKTEIKHCRRCSCKMTVILFQFYFMLCEPLKPKGNVYYSVSHVCANTQLFGWDPIFGSYARHTVHQ